MNCKLSRQRGIASVLAMLLLSTLVALSISYMAFANTSYLKANNLGKAQLARMQTESGFDFMNYKLKGCSLSPTATGQDLLDAIAADLASRLDGTGNFAGQTISYDGLTISTPAVSFKDGESFSAQLSLLTGDILRLVVTGQVDGIQRTLAMNFQVVPGTDFGGRAGTPPLGGGFFGYAVATKSAVLITGNGKVLGANSPDEAIVFSGTYETDRAIRLTGNAIIEGDVFMSNPDAYATLSGQSSIAGENSSSDDLDDHIHEDAGDVTFPEVDPTVFESFAVNIIDSGTDISGDLTLSNIRILAGVNPTFSGNVTINGVVYIESPNNVHFAGNVVITGVIVTEDAGEDVYDENRIKFTGNTSSLGVESLPETSEFSELRELTGSFILAPGFGLEFAGNFGTFSGTMAADSFKFTGNAGGIIKGMIINYSDSAFMVRGNSSITFDRSDDINDSLGTSREGTPAIPAGFLVPTTLSALPDTYEEL